MGNLGQWFFIVGELILESLTQIGEWHQNLSEKTAKDSFILDQMRKQYFSSIFFRSLIAVAFAFALI